MVRTNALGDENILDHRNRNIPAGDLGDQVIVEEAPGPIVGSQTSLVWKLRRVNDDGTIEWSSNPLATIFRNRAYRSISEQ